MILACRLASPWLLFVVILFAPGAGGAASVTRCVT